MAALSQTELTVVAKPAVMCQMTASPARALLDARWPHLVAHCEQVGAEASIACNVVAAATEVGGRANGWVGVCPGVSYVQFQLLLYLPGRCHCLDDGILLRSEGAKHATHPAKPGTNACEGCSGSSSSSRSDSQASRESQQ